MRIKLYGTAIALFALMLPLSCAMAQEIVGFWEVKEVKVGDELMTPVAKWFKINKDGTYQSGNGWQQNSVGTWTYDKKSRAYLPKENHGTGIEDEFGAFRVGFKDQKMIWEREEEGMKVVVSLAPITQLPMSPADQITGLWDLAKVTKNGEILTPGFDPDDQHFIFIRVDKIFMERTPEGERSMGYWFMNGHAPEITFISFNKERDQERWRVSTNGAELTMVGISDTNEGKELHYSRINEFPQ